MSDELEPKGVRGLLYRLEPTPGRQHPRHRRNGAIALVLAAIAFALAMTLGYYRDAPFIGGGEKIEARFAHVTNLRPGDQVRVRGVKVGKVTKIERDGDAREAVVTMEIKDGGDVDLKRDARASVQWRTLLGRNMYLDLDPGSPSAPRAEGNTIPISRTHSQVEFDQLFEPLHGSGRAAVQTALGELDEAFEQPGAPGQALERLGPAMRSVAPALDAVRGRRTGDLQRLVRSTGATMRALGRSQRQLAGLIDGADVTFGVTAARRADLGSTVRQAPQTLRDVRTTTARLRTTLDLLDPVAERLRPGARQLDDASRAVRPALAQATPLLADAGPLADRLGPTLAALRPASTRGVEVIRGLDPTLTRTTDRLIPWLYERNATKQRNYQAIGPTFSVLDSASSQFNGLGNQLRFQGMAGGERTVGLPCATFFMDPHADEKIKCERVSDMLDVLFNGGYKAQRRAR